MSRPFPLFFFLAVLSIGVSAADAQAPTPGTVNPRAVERGSRG
jgi:hypothetical protein